jgi:PKD repeat protein
MKKRYSNLLKTKISLLAGFLLMSGVSFGAFSGTYTIDATQAASSTNYKSFTALFGDLYNSTRTDGGTANGAGVTGPVIVNVVKGTGPYTEQVTFYQYSGISATNNIVINGNGNTLQFSATSSSTAHTVLFNGADFITIDNLVILATNATNGRNVHFMNDARNNTISNCTLQMPNMTSTSSNNAYVCLTQGTSSMQTYGVYGQDNTITGCTMNSITNGGPYSAIAVMDESSGSTIRKNTFSNNKIRDFRNYGFWIYYAFQQTIKGNEIYNSTSSNYATTIYGMYNYCYNKGGDFTIEDNYIHDLNTYSSGYQYGIYHYAYYGTGSGNLLINRNKVVLQKLGYYAYGMYIYGYYSSISGIFQANNNYVDLEQPSGNASYLYGMYCLGAYYNTAFKAANIDNNYVRLRTVYYGYGLLGYIYYNQQLTKRASISNNIIDAQTNNTLQAGIYGYCYSNNQQVDVCYNTIYTSNYLGGTITGTKYGMYLYYVDGKINNNNIVCRDNGGTTYGIYDYYNTASYSNNNFHDGNLGCTFIFGARNGSPFNDLAAYKTNFADANGMNIDPKLKSIPAQNYQPTSFSFVNKGVPTSGFTTDFSNVTRNTTNPDVGALEFYVDVNLQRLYFKGVNVCGGYKEKVTVTVRNATSDTIKNVPLKYAVTGKSPVKQSVPKVAPNDTVQFTFTQLAEFNGSGTNKIDVELDGSDDNATNNLLSKSLNVTPSPAGFELVEGTNFPGYFRPGKSGGTLAIPDATVPGRKIVYEIAPNTATGYTNSNYGSKWTLSYAFKTVGGNSISGATFTAPSGSSNGTVSFDPPSSLNDSTVYLNLFVKNLSTGCDSSFGRYVYIPHIVVPVFTATDVCEGQVAVFNNKSTLTKGVAQYKWKFNDKGTPEDSSFLIDPIFNFSTYGIYNVEMTAWNNAYPKFTTSYNRNVTVTPIPQISFKVQNACEKVAVKFVNSTTLPIPGTITYNWDFGDPTTTLDKSSTKDASWIYTNPGGYKVTLRATANGCTGELVKNANQFATPKATFNAPSLICDKSDVQFTNTSTIKLGNMGYTWNFGDGGVSNFANPVHQFADAASKTVKMKAVSEFGCSDSISKTITLSESPNADFTWGPACNQSNTNFTFTGSKPAAPAITNFNWNFAGEGTTTVENPSKLFGVVGKKMVTLTLVSNNGCSDVVTKEVNVKLQSKADFLSDDVCGDDDAVFINKSTVSAGNLNFNWKFGDGNNSAAQSPRHRYNIGGVSKTYNVTLVAIVPGGCSDSITKAVSVNANPDASFTYTKSGRLVNFTAKTTGATVYQWRFGDGGSAVTANPQYHYLAFPSGKYVACLAVVNAAGCFSETCQTIAITGGVDKLEKLSGVKVYPNPNNGAFTVTVEDPKSDLSIGVYNLLGDLIQTIDANALKSTYNVDLNVANGVYMVKVTNGGLVSTQKVTISK